MFPISRLLKRFIADEKGATMTEYGMLMLFIALVVVAVGKLLGQTVLPLYNLNPPQNN